MELERVGEILARGMNWTRLKDSHENQWWVIPAKDGKSFTHMLSSNWKPWESWAQCGFVIEAMQGQARTDAVVRLRAMAREFVLRRDG